jgi:hypothetical protein
MLSSFGGNPTREVSFKKVKVPTLMGASGLPWLSTIAWSWRVKQICIIYSLAIAISYGFPFSMTKSTYHGEMVMLR